MRAQSGSKSALCRRNPGVIECCAGCHSEDRQVLIASSCTCPGPIWDRHTSSQSSMATAIPGKTPASQVGAFARVETRRKRLRDPAYSSISSRRKGDLQSQSPWELYEPQIAARIDGLRCPPEHRLGASGEGAARRGFTAVSGRSLKCDNSAAVLPPGARWVIWRLRVRTPGCSRRLHRLYMGPAGVNDRRPCAMPTSMAVVASMVRSQPE